MNEKRLILVIEDEHAISNFICRALAANDYKAIPASSGKEGLSLFFSHSPDLSELLARIRTTLRRADRLKMSQGAQRDVYQVQDLVVDITKHQVLLAGEQIHFTQNEFKILELLCIHAGKVLTYDFILEHVWGPYGGNNNNQILRVNMANIRRKLKEDPSKPKYIHTELGIGYRMLED